MQLQFCRHAKCVYESVLILRRDCGKKYRVNNQHRFATMPPIYGVSCFKYCTSAFDKLSTLFSQHFSNTLVKQASNKLIKCLSNTLTNKYTVQILNHPHIGYTERVNWRTASWKLVFVVALQKTFDNLRFTTIKSYASRWDILIAVCKHNEEIGSAARTEWATFSKVELLLKGLNVELTILLPVRLLTSGRSKIYISNLEM